MERLRFTSSVLAGMLAFIVLGACSRKEPVQAAVPAPSPATASDVAATPAAAAYPTRVYFGDTHLHTALSMDAGASGTTLMPADSYRFAKGEEVTGASGQKARLSRRIIAFLFGLLHGLGFAGALSEVGLPDDAIPVALLFFNLGVEVGQLAFIVVVLGIKFVLARKIFANRPEHWSWRLPAYAIGTVAAFWTIERIVAF
ncbi:HupE/UreJ family protein [Pseudoxanthomonas daejeonensis]|nr:HupE/UreJ family protein [Pseudoxanthomonas daejeonensis]